MLGVSLTSAPLAGTVGIILPRLQAEQLRFERKEASYLRITCYLMENQDFNPGPGDPKACALCGIPGDLGADGSQRGGLFIEGRGQTHALL